MSYGQNLVHGKGTSLSRVGLYRFCSGNPWTNLPQGIVLGWAPIGFAVILSILLWSLKCVCVWQTCEKSCILLHLRRLKTCGGKPSRKTKVYKSWKQKNLCGLQSWQSQSPPCFHLASIPFQGLFWKDAQARHLSNTTNVSQVSNTTGTPLDSIFISPFRGLEPQTPFPSTRPLLLPCQFHCDSSRCT